MTNDGLRVGDRVRIDIPDTTDPDHETYHGRHGKIVEIIEDDAGQMTGDERDSNLYKVEFGDGDRMEFRVFDIRPPLEE